MSTAVPSAAAAEALAPAAPPESGRRRRRRLIAVIVLLVAVVAVVLIVTNAFGGGSSGGLRDNTSPSSLATVRRQSLSSLSLVSGTLGYTGDVTIDLSAGSAPATLTQAQQAVTTDRGTLASARSTLSNDSAALLQARGTLTADEQQEGVECTGDNAAQGGAAGGAGSGSGSACATDAQMVSSGQQSVTADQAKVASDEAAVPAAEHTLASDEAAVASASAQATVYGPNSAFTSIPSVGEVVRRGQSVFAIDGDPALLLYGSTAATRAFVAGMSPGADVAELNANLDALGYGHGLTGDAFTSATAAAIRALQAAHSEFASGELLIGSVEFAPGPIRVTSLTSTVVVGAAVVAGPVLTATGTARQVQIQLDPALEGQVRAGDPVTITLPNDRTMPGRITSVSTVATPGQNGSPPTIAVDAVPTDPAGIGNLDQAPVNVSITTGSVSNALVVPVDALLALEGGGYAVEVVAANGVHHLEAVSTGLFDDADGLVQVTGPQIAAGQRVVVPGL